MTSTARDLRALPKAHLHLHLDGALRRSTYLELAEAAGLPAPLPTSYGSFAAFGETMAAAAAVLRTESDVRRLVREVVEDAALAGAVWVEVSMWPGFLAGRLGPDEKAIDAVLSAGTEAAAEFRTGFGLIVAANRDRGPAEALSMARLAVARGGAGVVGFGLDGDESAAPPEAFADAFALARTGGLRSLPHAGELLGPASVAAALDVLRADRILHGVRALEDPALVDRLAASGVSLDVCPTSNVLLSVVPSMADHPLPRLLAAGVRCSVNADDPMVFDTDLTAEYAECRNSLGLTDEQLAGIARTSVESSAAPPDVVRSAVAGIDAWLAPGVG